MYFHIEVRAGLRVLYRKGMGEYFREGARPRVPLLAKRGRTAYANVGLLANFTLKKWTRANDVIRRAIYHYLFRKAIQPKQAARFETKTWDNRSLSRTMGKWRWPRNDPLRASFLFQITLRGRCDEERVGHDCPTLRCHIVMYRAPWRAVPPGDQ